MEIKDKNMNKNKYTQQADEAEMRDPNIEEANIEDVVPDEEASETEEITDGQGEMEALKNMLDAEQKKVESVKKDYMFLLAEFDNFKKRTLKEKSDLLKNGAESALKGLLPIVDDFERGLDAIKESSDAASVKEGMELIYNKFIKYLASNGVKAIDSTGATFDADVHEAIAMIPAPTEDQKGKVIDTVSKGYMLNDKVLRHAKVAVGQ